MFYIIMIAPVLIAMVAWVLVSAWLRRKIPAHKRKIKTAFAVFSFIVLALIPTYDIIITNILGAYYCKTTPKPFLKEQILYPESIYFEDNIQFFTKEDMALMVNDYLDGIHLKNISFNGDDGKFYTYSLDEKSYKYKQYITAVRELITVKNSENLIRKEMRLKFETKEIQLSSNKHKKYLEQLNNLELKIKYLEPIVKKLQDEIFVETVGTKDKIRSPNYIVKFDEIDLNNFNSNFLYSYKMTVLDKQNEVIGFDIKFRRFFYMLVPDFVGNWYFDDRNICQNKEIDYKDIFDMQKWRMTGTGGHKISLNKFLFMKKEK